MNNYRLASDFNVQGQHHMAPGLRGCAGLGGCGCGGTCGGLGLFDSGMDFTTWGWAEWATVGMGLYTLFSFVGDTKRGVTRVRRVGKAVRKAV